MFAPFLYEKTKFSFHFIQSGKYVSFSENKPNLRLFFDKTPSINNILYVIAWLVGWLLVVLNIFTRIPVIGSASPLMFGELFLLIFEKLGKGPG